jgi:hypothetical protein
MYLSVRTYPASSDLVALLQQNEDEISRLIGGIDGFRAYYLVRTASGDAMSVSVFDDRDGAEQSNRVAADWVRENAAGVATGAPEISAGEAVIAF